MGALAEYGIQATQATVSRDLSAMGAVRGSDGYRLLGAASNNSVMSEDLEQLFTSHAIGVVLADSIVVVKTAPGHASLLAVGFDRSPPGGVAGCVAGDDTIFLATKSRTQASKVCEKLVSLLGGDHG